MKAVCRDRYFRNICGCLSFFMRSPMQRKYAAEAAHGARGEQGEKSFPPDFASTMKMTVKVTVIKRVDVLY